MKVLYINNDGGGFADQVDIVENTTVAGFFSQHMGECSNPSEYLIRVNRQPCTQNQVLQDGDRITITPVKIEGANN